MSSIPCCVCLRGRVALGDDAGARLAIQAEAAAALGILQPHVSDLARYRLDRFAVERLMAFLVALGRDVEIRIGGRAGRGSRPGVRVSHAS